MPGDLSKSVDRETLYNEVWTDPVTVVASRYGLSDVGLAKICRTLSIPLPSRGYWAKIKAGRMMSRAPLPKLKAPVLRDMRLVKLPEEKIAKLEAAKESATRIRNRVAAVDINPTEGSAEQHPLVKAASKRLRQRDGWPANTLLRSAPDEVLNLSVSQDALDRALAFANLLLNALDKEGFYCEIDRRKNKTLLRSRITGTTVPLAIEEKIQRSRHEPTPAEKRARERYYSSPYWERRGDYPSIPEFDYASTGLLTLRVGSYARNWNDTARTKLEQRLGTVVSEIIVLMQEAYEREQEEIRRAEARQRAMERYEYLTKRRKMEAAKFKELEAEADNLDRATKLRAYADAVERQAVDNGMVDSPEIADWLAWARAKADWLDPLVPVSDLILDAPEPKSSGWY